MNKGLLSFFDLFLIFLSGSLAFFIGDTMKGSYQMEIYKILVTVSGIVFGVMGAWLSILKIEIEQGVKKSVSDIEGDGYVKQARSLIQPMTLSAIIIILSVLYTFSYYSLKDVEEFQNYSVFLRRFSFFVLCVLSFIQIKSIFYLLFSGLDFLITLSRENEDIKGDRKR
jgi:hypothetical protein